MLVSVNDNRGINLADYAPEYQASIEVWVNPPRETVLKLHDAVKSVAENPDTLRDLLVELWSQGEDKWTREDVDKFISNCTDTSPALFAFCVTQTMEKIGEHRRGAKKKPSEPLFS